MTEEDIPLSDVAYRLSGTPPILAKQLKRSSGNHRLSFWKFCKERETFIYNQLQNESRSAVATRAWLQTQNERLNQASEIVESILISLAKY